MPRTTHAAAGAVLIAGVVAACGGGAATAAPTVAPTTTVATQAPTTAAAPTQAPTAIATPVPTGPATVDAPATVQAGSQLQVAWTGPNAPGDYVTIVRKGATQWTNESYFDTTAGSPGTLQAALDAGDYEIWYVRGADMSVRARAAITVTPVSATVTGPASAPNGSTFDVQWTGPDGSGDYVTIAPAGSPEGTYLSYCDTARGPTCTLTAPDEPGSYELRYVSGGGKTLASTPIAIQ